MEVVWDRGSATARDVQEALFDKHGYAHTTIITVLTRLQDKGVVNGVKDGRSYRFTPAVERAEAVSRSLGKVADQYFEGSARELVAHLVQHEEISTLELSALRDIIDDSVKKRSK